MLKAKNKKFGLENHHDKDKENHVNKPEDNLHNKRNDDDHGSAVIGNCSQGGKVGEIGLFISPKSPKFNLWVLL